VVRFQVGLTADFLKEDGTPITPDLGLSVFADQPGVGHRFLSRRTDELVPSDIADLDAVIVLSPRVTARTVSGAERLLLVARTGVGLDSVDVAACTSAGVLVTITPEGVGRAMALAALTLILALTHRLLPKDRMTREGRWSDRSDYFGAAVVGQLAGIVGYGKIGHEVARLVSAVGMRVAASDPAADPIGAAKEGVTLMSLHELMASADVVVVCCALTPETFHLIDGDAIARMKRTAYLVNIARGPIVDQAALTAALSSGALAGAGLDVFEKEPIDPDDPLLRLENVVLAPHSLGWTDQVFRDNGLSAASAALDVASGRVPRFLVNREVLDHPRVRDRIREAGGGHA
jgi:D-3-phosphoglycerate dehydrogenase